VNTCTSTARNASANATIGGLRLSEDAFEVRGGGGVQLEQVLDQVLELLAADRVVLAP
jgi:hypothetical protein